MNPTEGTAFRTAEGSATTLPSALAEKPGVSTAPQTATLAQAYARYEAIRNRLPVAGAAGATFVARGLAETFERYDGYLFDSFGVLNVGETAIAGAAECLFELRRLDKPFRVLTNAASYTSVAALEKYRSMGLDVRAGEVVSSRDVCWAGLDRLAPGLHWSAISAEGDRFEDARVPVLDLLDEDADWRDAEAFLFLSSARWNAPLQERLARELRRNPRPVAVANPDLVAPREGGLSLEPGWWAHDLQDRTGVEPVFFGKPFASSFAIAASTLPGLRLAMVGDTLHTDILGGQAAGLATILVTEHGLFAGEDVSGYVDDSGIVPDVVLPSI